MPASRLPGLAALLLLGCFGLVALSTPRRVGDGVEYWAMADQLGSFRLPSATRADILRLERDARRLGHGFDASPLRFPHLVAADGRQDFPHFWLYSLVNVPALWLTRLAGAHPNWAFTLTNCALLVMAFVIVSREVSTAWAALILVGPLIWWLDKAHGDVFTVTLLAAACALWRRAPLWTLLLLAIAAAQNPVLMPVWALVAIVALSRASARGEETRDVGSRAPAEPPGDSPREALSRRRRRLAPVMRASVGRSVLLGVVLGAAIVAVPLAYYFVRLHVWSPLAGYTRPAWPSVRTMGSLVWDANVGLFANVPFFGVAMIGAIADAWRRRRRVPLVGRDWLLLAGAWGLLLAGYAQSVNLNHGATPGINRWTFWLMPWLLLVVSTGAASQTSAMTRHQRAPAVLIVLAALNTASAVWFFRPSLPEVYRYPTLLASWLWTHAPAWYSPAPEIFAERVSHREPPVLPTAWEGCTKVLTIDGQWPVPCLPPTRVPPACFGPDVLCYASRSADTCAALPDDRTDRTDRTSFVPLGTAPFPWLLASRRWSASAPFVAALRTRIAAGLARDPQLRPRKVSESALRATDGVGWVSVWMGASTIAIYLDTVAQDASLQVRVDGDHHGELTDLDTSRVLATVDVSRSGEQPTAIVVPTAVPHALLWLQRDERVPQ
jgi:hypothetical protein